MHRLNTKHNHRCDIRVAVVACLALVLPGFQSAGLQAQTLAVPPPPPEASVLRMSMDEAVATAIEQNLNLQVQRFNPQIQNALNAQLVATYTPTFTSALEVAGVDQPPASVLSGSLSQIKDRRLVLNVGVGAPTRWHGGAYQIDFNTGRYRTNNWFASFDPQLSSVLSFTYRQPLLRNLKIDGTRQQLLVFEKNKEISDVQLQQAVYDTVRKVRNAYYDLMYAIENLNAQRQSVDIAAQLLKGNQEAVEAGMMAPLDIIQVEAEVAMRQESVIPAEVAVDRAQLALRALVFKPTGTDFRALRIEPTEVIAFQPIELDVDGAIKKALGQRSDVVVARKSMEADNVKIRYFEDQVKPSMDASITYSAQAVGGDSLVRGPFSFDTLEPGPIVGKIGNGYPGVLGRMFSGDAPGWTLKLSGSYPLGRSADDAQLARARIQHTQAEHQLQGLEQQVLAQVRDYGLQVQANAKRVGAARLTRVLLQRRLAGEEKKVQAGMAGSFLVLQAQRDLNTARNNELLAMAEYAKSIVNYSTIQQIPF